MGQGVRGLVRGHHDSARRRAHPERQPRFRARHRLRVRGRSRAAARVPGARPGRRAVLPQPVDHGAAARRLAGRGETAAPQRRILSGVADDKRGARGAGRAVVLHLHFNRHHRPQEERGAHPVSGAAGRAHRAAQSIAVHRAAAHRAAAGGPLQKKSGGAVHRFGPLQEHQRFARPPHRRRAAALGRAAPYGHRAHRRHGEPPWRRRVHRRAERRGRQRRGGVPRPAPADPAGARSTSPAAWASQSTPTTAPTSTS